MAVGNPSRVGQVNQAGDVDALFLQVYGGEVLKAFDEASIMKGNHLERKISHGKSASFPATWKLTAEYHTPGAEITGMNMNHAERVITIDDLLISHAFLSNIDEAKNHYDVRSIYSHQTGQALANEYDKNVFINLILAARASATVTGGYGGTVVTVSGTLANLSTDYGTKLAAAMYAGKQAMDEKDVPDMGTKAVFRPAEFYALVTETDNINQDWKGAGSFAEGNIVSIAGVPIHKNNHLPSTNITGGTHNVDASKTLGAMWQNHAVGTVKLMDLATESEYDIRRQGWLIVAKYACGHGILRPECAVEIEKPAA